MAEAAAALGVAAAAVQFFDFSLKALSLCKEIRDSEKGASQANQELEECSVKLKQVYEDLKVDTRLQIADRPITKARQDCMAVVGDLLKLLNDVKSKSRDKNLAAVKAAFRVLKNKRGIEVLQNKLSQAQTRFMSAVSIETKNDVAILLEKQDKLSDTIQKKVLPELLKTHAASVAGHKKTQEQLMKVAVASSVSHSKTHDLVQNIQKHQQSSLKVAESTELALSKGLATIGAQTGSIAVDAEMANRRKNLMDSLWYPGIFDRQQSIKPPLFETFQWIFDNSPALDNKTQAIYDSKQSRDAMRGTFARWLRSDEPLFWISGKAGSGKSSLMSLIQSDPRTSEALSVWSSGRRLYKFSFYFWRPGSSPQKTIHGLVRSLLYQLAQANPIVVDYLTATQYNHCSDWTTVSLLSALRVALSAFHDGCIFLMVDGLDEYEEDYDDLLDLILECQQKACLKVCVASRPETQILNKLSRCPFLRLQDLNYADIELFVHGRLKPYESCITNEIRNRVIRDAEGVFLWAVLVSDHLKRGVSAGDDTEMLKRRLDSTPRELHQLFRQWLEDIDEEHLETLKLCLFHLEGWNWREEVSCASSVGLITASMPKCNGVENGVDFVKLCVKTSKDLIAQGKGLFELRDPDVLTTDTPWHFDSIQNTFVPVDWDDMALCQSRIKFVHTSAHDFMFDGEQSNHEHNRWDLTEDDFEKFFQWTLQGTVTLFQFLPLSFADDYPFVSNCWPSEMVRVIENLLKGTGREHRNVAQWLDRIYEMVPERFATKREVSLCPAASRAWSKKVDLSISWHAEKHFWRMAHSIDGYLESRWNRLAQHAHVRAICSEIIRSERWDTSKPSIKRCLGRLLEGSCQGDPGDAVHPISYIRGTNARDKFGGPWSLSWDIAGGLDEMYIMTKMVTILRALYPQEWHWPYDDTSVQSPVVFVGRSLDLEAVPLDIQIAVRSAKIWQKSLPFSDILGYGTTRMRLLSFARQGEKKDSEIPTEIPLTSCDIYNALIEDVCDVDVDFRGVVLHQPVRFCDNAQSFPHFTGTKDQFDDCLEQVKNEVRDKQWPTAQQQLNMLQLVEEHFVDYWTLVTPETLELTEFTLEYCSKYGIRHGKLLGDLE